MEDYQRYSEVPTFPMEMQWCSKQPSTLEEDFADHTASCRVHSNAPTARSYSCGMNHNHSRNFLNFEGTTDHCMEMEYDHNPCAVCFTKTGLDHCNESYDTELYETFHHQNNKDDVISSSPFHLDPLDDSILELPSEETPIMPCYDATVEGYENGAVVAAVLGLGVGCVAVCCIWHLIHVLPLVIIPTIYFYRNKLRPLDFIFAFFPTLRRDNGRKKMNLEGNHMNVAAMAGGDQTLWESMKVLKKQNERLTRELNRQSRVTQFLLKQLEDMTSMSNTEESNEEQIAAHDDIFEEEDQISGR